MDLFNTDRFAKRVDELLEEWHVPGMAIAVVQDDKIDSRGFGKACLDPEKPVTADTIFDIASCSKSTTAGATALLVEDEENYPDVKWDAKMSALLPDDFVMSDDSYTKDVTLEDIFSHRTGLPSHDLSYKHGDTPRSVTRNIRNLKITKPIRTTEQYCNMMYTVATQLIETQTKQSFASFVKDRIWTPLGMNSTNIQPDSAIAAGLKDRIFTPYLWVEEERTYRAGKLQQIPESQGAGSVFTCVNDYILWVKAMMNQEHPVTQGVYEGMTRPRIISNPDDGPSDLDSFTSHTMYAAGLEVRFYRGHQIISHTGGDPGIGTFHFFLPSIKFGGVLFGNSWRAGEAAQVLAHELIDAVLGVPENERPDWNAREHKEDDEFHAKRDEGWKKMLGIPLDGDVPGSEPQTRALGFYTGRYSNVGYHEMVVEIKDERLFIDATDRTMGFWLRLEHFRDQERYVAHSEDYYDGAKGKVAIKFRFDGESGKAASLGVDLEEAVGDFIWFDRI